jgi:hypothetical protein
VKVSPQTTQSTLSSPPLTSGSGIGDPRWQAARYLALGWSLPQVAQYLEIPFSELYQLSKLPDFQIEVDQLRAEFSADAATLRLRLELVATQALDTLIDLMVGSRWDSVRQKAASELLDRAGYVAVQKVESTQRVVIDKKVAHLIAITTAELSGQASPSLGLGLEVEVK